MYGTCSLAMVISIVLFMPETRGQPLEAIDEIFSKPMLRSWGNVRQLFSRATTALSGSSTSSDTSSNASIGRVMSTDGASLQPSIELREFLSETSGRQDVPIRPASIIS